MSGLRPEESSHRASTLAVDLAVMYAKVLDMIGQFVSKHELFHIQMQFLYVILDLMAATSKCDPEFACEEAKRYFQNLRKERSTLQ